MRVDVPIALCLCGHPRTLPRPHVHGSIAQNVLQSLRSTGSVLDVFAVLKAGTDASPKPQAGWNFSQVETDEHEVWKAISSLQSIALTINTFSNDLDADAFVLPADTWRLGIARVSQGQINAALEAARAWEQVGGLNPNYDVTHSTYGLDPIESSWRDAESTFETELTSDPTGELDAFIGAFTGSEANCKAHYVFEAVDAWWDTASEGSCDSGDYAMPAACNEGVWPLHNTATVVE